MRNTRLDELQAGIKIGERNINNFRYMDDTILMAESKEELKSLLMRVKEGSETAGLKLKKKKKNHSIQPHYFMANRGGKGGNSDRFTLLGSKITVDDGCSHEVRRHFLLGRKAITNLDSALKRETLLCQQRSV